MKRLPLFEKKIEKNIAEDRCESIASALTRCSSSDIKPGWLDGLAGISCFFFHYYRYTGKKTYESQAYSALEKLIERIEKGFSNPSFASGLSGVHWILKYFGKMGFIDQTGASMLNELQPLFYTFAQEKFKSDEYDYLHGALGAYTALFNKNQSTNTNSQPNLNKLIPLIKSELLRLSFKNQNNSIYWKSIDYQTGKYEINMGLAHGIPSILIILSRIYKMTGDEEILNKLIKPGLEFLMNFRNEELNEISQFPTQIKNGNGIWPSRMAWCYGDPGIGLALLQIGVNCNRLEWKSIGLEILKLASLRRNREDTLVSDACLCHGSSGLALIYYSAGLDTNYEPFFETSQFWAKETLKFGRNSHVHGNYLFHSGAGQFQPSFNVLEGIAGVGLFLIAMLEGENPGWGEGMLFP